MLSVVKKAYVYENVVFPFRGIQQKWGIMDKKKETDYMTFRRKICQTIKSGVSDNVRVDIHPVVKNNATHLDGLTILRQEDKMSPNFYLQDYYRRYREGETIQQLAEEILITWETMDYDELDIPLDFSFAHVKDKIVYRLVSTEKNREILEEVPHIPFLDLSILFYYVAHYSGEDMRSLRITNELAQRWQVQVSDLWKLAIVNAQRMFPAVCCRLEDTIHCLLFQKSEPENILLSGDVKQKAEPEVRAQMHVLTNANRINGASVWLYPDVMERLAEYLQSSFYILPSSIHELMILADRGSIKLPELQAMVKQVNNDCVAVEEVLSDQVYYYDRRKKAMRVLGYADCKAGTM